MEGYAKLAKLMGSDQTDGHFLIFQKFEDLSAQNLLYLQAEILALREDLVKYAKEDAESGDPEKALFTQDWTELSSSSSEQWDTWKELRATLKQYYKAIAQHRMISSIPTPDTHDLRFLRQWLERPNMGSCTFIGADRNVYAKENESGLGSLVHGGDSDVLTRSLLYSVPRLFHGVIVAPFHRLFGKWIKKPETSSLPVPIVLRPDSQSTSRTSTTLSPGQPSLTLTTLNSASFDAESGIFLYRDSHLHRLANILGTLISSLIPIAAIVVLYFVQAMTARLTVVGLFTALFSIALSLVTNAKRVEIFAATAAFASVQVVFVGSVRGG